MEGVVGRWDWGESDPLSDIGEAEGQGEGRGEMGEEGGRSRSEPQSKQMRPYTNFTRLYIHELHSRYTCVYMSLQPSSDIEWTVDCREWEWGHE